ncbi:MAG TPA: AmmeMemoRadiSam system protein A [Candidatus Angelobacter sp.]|nr:AmmeMemoRadiSam system protein A [Candidatus Angelobacter sp.]
MFPQSEAEAPAASAEYSPEERALLLQLAHRAIDTALQGTRPNLTPPTPHLAEKRGAFTTLHLLGRLRCCIGYVVPRHPLYRTVAEAARAAAFDDPRFPPVTAAEAPNLVVEISVLSVITPVITSDILVGRHGLIVSQGKQRGLLLPQVPVEWGWDRETFLAQTCLKAGLPPDAWRQGAEIEAFTAEVFGESEIRAKTP